MQNEIQVGRINAILHKLLQMKEGAPSPTLATDIFPVLALEVDRPEWKALAGERLCVSGGSVGAGGAGNYNEFQILNPSGSDAIVIVERVKLWQTGSTPYSGTIRQHNGVMTGETALIRMFRDGRLGWYDNINRTVAHVSRYTGATTWGNTCGAWGCPANGVPVYLDVPWVLSAGDGLVFLSSTNVTLGCTFWWRERYLEPSEKR